MNRLIIRALVGLLCRIISKPLTIEAHNCDLIVISGYLTCNCTHRKFVEVPKDLNPAIQILFLMYSNFTRLDENSFIKYTKLQAIYMQFTSFEDYVDPINYYTFRPLEMLENLDMSNMDTPVNFSLYWPPTLRTIWASNNPFMNKLDLSTLKELQFLYVESCGLESFPKLNKLTPLKLLDLRFNPMENLSVEDIAPFCLLKWLGLEWHRASPLSTTDRFCQCSRLAKWLLMFEIHYKIGTSRPSFACFSLSEAGKRKCDLEFSEELLRQRVECIANNSQPLFSAWFLVVVAIIALTPFIILACWYSERQQKALLRKQLTSEGEPVTDEHDGYD